MKCFDIPGESGIDTCLAIGLSHADINKILAGRDGAEIDFPERKFVMIQVDHLRIKIFPASEPEPVRYDLEKQAFLIPLSDNRLNQMLHGCFLMASHFFAQSLYVLVFFYAETDEDLHIQVGGYGTKPCLILPGSMARTSPT